MDDSLQQLLDAAEPEFPTQNATILSTTTVGSGSDSAVEINHSKLEAAMTRRRPAPRGTAAYPRKRANRACQVCRARRTKCDNKKPSCSFCEKVGANFDPASLAILDRLEQLEKLIREKSLDEANVHPAPPSVEQSALSYGSPPPDLQFGPDLSTVTIETVLAWDVFQGRFDPQLDIKSVLKNYEMPPSPMSSPVGEAIPLINSLELGSCNRLLDSFLSRVHIANPILDVELIRSYVNHACLHGIGWDAQSCLVLLVCALGSITEAFHDLHPHTSLMARNSPSFGLAKVFFEASQKRIGLLMRGSGVLEAQCFFYSGVYLMTIQQPMDAWRHFVQAAAISQGFDFLRRSLTADMLIGDGMQRNELHKKVFIGRALNQSSRFEWSYPYQVSGYRICLIPVHSLAHH
uniref:Oleate-activated transcription factor 1 n=1 Tax=Talaromyces marneffei PM1 TaxID=1077442 RepID=A0A093V1K4_TALMA